VEREMADGQEGDVLQRLHEHLKDIARRRVAP